VAVSDFVEVLYSSYGREQVHEVCEEFRGVLEKMGDVAQRDCQENVRDEVVFG